MSAAGPPQGANHAPSGGVGVHTSAAGPVATEAGFAPDDAGARWIFSGALTSANAGRVLAAAAGLRLPGDGDVDLRDMDAIDSAAVAVLLALKRRAAEEGRPLRFLGVPAALTSLAELYGVREILVA